MKKKTLVLLLGIVIFATSALAVTYQDESTFLKNVIFKKVIRLYGAATAYYFTITGTPTANRTITIPDVTGSMGINATVSKSVADSSGATTLTATESQASYFTAGGTLSHYSTGAFSLVATGCSSGKIVAVYNYDASNNLTLKVTGQSGAAVAAGKKALFVCTGTDFMVMSADK